MTDCTEPRPPVAGNGRDGEGHEVIPQEAQP